MPSPALRNPPTNPPARRWLAALAIVLAASKADAAPATQSISLVSDPTAKLSVEATGWLGLNPVAAGTGSGLMAVRIRAVNGGPREALVTVAPSTTRFSFGSGGIVAPRTAFRVPPGETVAETLFVDPMTIRQGSADKPVVQIAARTTGTRTDLDLGVGWSFSGAGTATVVVPGAPDPPVAGAREATAPRVYTAEALRLLRPSTAEWPPTSGLGEAEIDIASAPDDWRGFTPLREIVIAEVDWTTLPSGQRRALLAWVGLGGLLEVVAEDTDAGRLERLGLPRAAHDGRRHAGAGEVMVVPPGEETWNAFHGLGGAVAAARPPMRSAEGAWRSAGFARSAGFGPRTLPFEPILCFLAIFAVVAGPLNVMFFAGRRRPARIFWTTPAIALVATSALVALMLLRDGVGGDGARLTLCILDPDRTAAHVLQQQVSRTGVLVGSSFPIRETSWMHPEPPDVYDPSGVVSVGSVRAFSEVEATRRTGEWFSSRADQAFTLQAVRSSRGRLVVSGPEDAPEIVSSIDTPLARVVVVDSAGRLWRCGALGPGERRSLEAATQTDLDAVRSFSSEACPAIGLALERLGAAPGYAWAEAETPAGVAIASLDAIRWRSDRAVFVTPIAAGEEP